MSIRVKFSSDWAKPKRRFVLPLSCCVVMDVEDGQGNYMAGLACTVSAQYSHPELPIRSWQYRTLEWKSQWTNLTIPGVEHYLRPYEPLPSAPLPVDWLESRLSSDPLEAALYCSLLTDRFMKFVARMEETYSCTEDIFHDVLPAQLFASAMAGLINRNSGVVELEKTFA